MTGGDLVKAVYVARDHRGQWPTAVISVAVDRVIGLFGLTLVGSVVLCFKLEEFGRIALFVNALIVAMLLGAFVLFSVRIRRLLRIEALLEKLPLAGVLQTIDRSVQAYRSAGRSILAAIGLSVLVHVTILSAIASVGVAVGLELPFGTYYALAPLVLIIQAVPVAPGGVGIGEAAYVYFFAESTGLTTGSEALALALSYRAVQIVASLLGGSFLLTGERRVTREELEQS
jgi:hypothetical protein